MPSLAQLLLGNMPPVPSHKSTTAQGLIVPGNIAIADRPVVKNPDGSISSVRSMGIEDENPKSPYYGKQVLIPTVIPDASGKWTVDTSPKGMAARAYYYKTGQHLGVFDTPQASDTYAERLHEDYMNGVYGPQYVPQGYTPQR
jgi:hypothetical protein